MNNRKIYLIIVLILAIAALALGFIRIMGLISDRTDKAIVDGRDDDGKNIEKDLDDGQEEAGEKETDRDDEDKELNDSDIYRLAVKNGDAGECSRMKDKGLVGICIALISQNNLDINGCSSIKDEEKAAECKDMTYMKRARQNGDPSECAEVQDDSLARSCVVNIVNDRKLSFEDCSELKGREKDDCQDYTGYLNDVAIFRDPQSIEDCERISTESVKEHCLDKFPG